MDIPAEISALSQLPPETRVWLFALERPLDNEAIHGAQRELDNFVAGWKAHGNPVRGAAGILHRRFVVLAADPAACDVSGCSIDSMFRAVSGAVKSTGGELAELSQVFYRNADGEIESVSREEFRELQSAGKINADTAVFDNTIQTLADLRSRWEIPARESWHRALLA